MSDAKNRRFNQRVKLDEAISVHMRSIGGVAKYELQSFNISHTGLFLDFENPGRFPFTPASIMEVWVYLPSSKVLFFNGKMARVVYPDEIAADDTGPGIAVRIVQMDKANEEMLANFIEESVSEKHSESDKVA